MTTVIIDYGSGNLRSCAKAFERMAQGKNIVVTSDPKALKTASHIVLPGVGAFADCMRGLRAISGMIEAFEAEVLHKQKQFLGICVGMQLLFERGFEHGQHQGLGWLKGDVVKLAPQDTKLKIPHMGWNDLTLHTESPLLKNITTGAHAYFVHSYHAKAEAEDILATTDYGGDVTAMVQRNNIYGVQFHPEKSQETGLTLIANFLAL